MNNKIFLILISLMILSCGDKQKSTTSEGPSIEGFWNRIGTIQYVNGVPVDTAYIKESEFPNYKQIKVFKDGSMIWINNAKDTLLPWKGGSGGYGKFVINSKDSITEDISHGTGWWGTMVKDLSQFINFAAFSPLTAALPLLAAGAIALLTVAVNFVVDWMLHQSSGLKE